MEKEDLSIELEKIEYKKRQEVAKNENYDKFKENMKKLEQERLELISKIVNENK